MSLGANASGATRAPRRFAMPLAARTAGLVAMAAGMAILVVRASGVGSPALLSPLFGRMNPTTALCCILLGVATLVPRRPQSLAAALAKPVIGGAVAVLGATKLLGLAIHHDFGIDSFLFSLLGSSNRQAVVAPLTAACLVLLGSAIPCAASRVKSAARISQVSGFVVLSISTTVLIGYFYGATSGAGYPALGGMAAVTAAALLSLAIGVINTRPHKFIAGILTNHGPSGKIARRLFWLVTPVTFILGELRILSLRFELMGHVTGATVLTGSLLTVMVVIILLTCNELRVNVTRERKLRAARDAAIVAGRAKAEFLATVSHEIRSPLTAVIGFAELLVESDLPEQQRHDALRCHDAAQSLLAIVNDILDLSKIEAGKLDFVREPISPASVIYSATSILGSKSRAKSIEINVQEAPDLPAWIEGDQTRLLQILLNLLSNAIKFTQAGAITIRCARERGDKSLLRFEVQDPGNGISKADQAALFQPFVQVDRSTTRSHGGTGLGLAISKRLAEAMGGTIGVDSELGQGSIFWFTIGLVECEPAVQPALPEPTTIPLVAANILVADDVGPIQEVISAMLRTAGHRVRVVDDGRAALLAVQQFHYDVVLMDMEMPNMDGISATRAIRALDGPVAQTPIIALTANATLQDSLRCKAAGMNDFLQKPIKRDALLAAVARCAQKLSPAPDAEPSTADGGLDTGVLDELEALLGRHGVVQLCTKFLQRLELELAGLASAGDEGARHAHTLVGLAGQVGCMELSDRARNLCEALEQRAGNAPEIAAQVTAAAHHAATALRVRYVM